MKKNIIFDECTHTNHQPLNSNSISTTYLTNFYFILQFLPTSIFQRLFIWKNVAIYLFFMSYRHECCSENNSWIKNSIHKQLNCWQAHTTIGISIINIECKSNMDNILFFLFFISSVRLCTMYIVSTIHIHSSIQLILWNCKLDDL